MKYLLVTGALVVVFSLGMALALELMGTLSAYICGFVYGVISVAAANAILWFAK